LGTGTLRWVSGCADVRARAHATACSCQASAITLRSLRSARTINAPVNLMLSSQPVDMDALFKLGVRRLTWGPAFQSQMQ
jgi:hypothetical protein